MAIQMSAWSGDLHIYKQPGGIVNSSRSQYKGHSITTRWYDNGQVSTSNASRFDAFYRVDPDAPQDDSWQVFLVRRFATRQDAVANALAKAELSVDMAIAAH